MTPTGRDPTTALEQFLLGHVPPGETEQLCAKYADDERLAEIAERLGPGDSYLETIRVQATSPEPDADSRVEQLIDRLLSTVPPALTPSPEQAPTISLNDAKAIRGTGLNGRRLDQFELVRVLGEGGMGTVYLAHDTRLNRQVALKTMRPDLAANAAARERFLREARCAAAIEHENIIAIYHVGESEGVPFLAMPLMKGEGLDKRLARSKGEPLPLREMLAIARGIAEGLVAAHSRGLVHRDVKPGNVWLEDRGEGQTPRVKILDFGLARPASDDANLTRSGAIVGTPAYMAPEQARGEPVDARTDLFSLGCVLYHLATGHPPFRGQNTIAVLTSLAVDHPLSPSDYNPTLPPELSALIDRLLEKDPSLRPDSARDVARALASIDSELHAAPSIVPQRTRLRRWGAVAAGLVAVAVLAVVAGQQIIIIRDKNGKQVGQATVPPGGSFEFRSGGNDPKGEVPAVPGKTDPLPLAEWMKGRHVLKVAQNGQEAYRTIQAALDAVKAGEVILVTDQGPYRERFVLPKGVENIGLVSLVGTRVDAPEWYQWGPAPWDKSKFIYQGCLLISPKGLRVSGFEISCPTPPPDTEHAIALEAYAEGDVTIEQCRFSYKPPGENVNAHDYADTAKFIGLIVGSVGGEKARYVIQYNRIDGRLSFRNDFPAYIVIQRNWIRGQSLWQVELPDSRSGETAITHNVIHGFNGIAIRSRDPDQASAAAGRCLIANNVIDVANCPVFAMAEDKGRKDRKFLCPTVRIQNNILRSHSGTGVELHADDLPTMKDVWQVDHNCYSAAPKLAGPNNYPVISHGSTDLLLNTQFLSINPKEPQFLRIASDSKLATGGAGGDLPKYIGAFPPGPAPKEGDWFTRLQDASRRALDPLADLQGEYVLVSREVNGEKPSDESGRRYKLTIKGDQWILNPGPTATIKMDASKNPKWFDVGKYGLGIFKLEGDTLTICRKSDGSRTDRPSEFKTTKDNGNVIVVYRRSTSLPTPDVKDR